ncbi:energy transducer TonB [Providencia rettgeri]|uniref:energy transducer TonB n=1 Tax=Providencia rettgeri TaxID=587 RepID=UPI0034E0AFF5
MTHSRFITAMVASLALHCGLIYYSQHVGTALAKIAVPVNATVMTLAMTQFLLEKHVSTVDEVISDSGGQISSPIELEQAIIEVAKEQNETDNEDRSAKTTPAVSKPKEQVKKQPKKKVESKEVVKKPNSDEVEQPSKAGESEITSQASGVQGNQQTVAVGEQLEDIRLSYLAKVRNELERHKKYPRRARTMGIEGSVVLHFQLTSQGELINVSIVSSEHNEIFNKAVLNAVKRYRSVGPKPESVKALNQIQIHFLLDK